MNTHFGADVHKGFTKNTSKSGFRHSILHPYPTAETEQKKGQILCRTKNELTYRQVSDYLIPNLTLPPEEANIHLGKWGERVPEALKRANRPSRRLDMLHKDYLQKHKPVVFSTFLAQGKLWQYLADIDTQAQRMFDTLVEQNEREGVCCRATQR